MYTEDDIQVGVFIYSIISDTFYVIMDIDSSGLVSYSDSQPASDLQGGDIFKVPKICFTDVLNKCDPGYILLKTEKDKLAFILQNEYK